MIKQKKYTTEVGGKTVTLEVSSLAEQANAAILGTCGQTSVLVTVVMPEKESTANYLPLKVDYEERFYAAGKILGSRFIRREGRPSEDAILSGRLVDRTIRPLFDQRLRRDVQVVLTVLSFDEENDPDFVGLLAASCALAISNIPWNGPVAGIRVAKHGNDFIVNPTNSQLAAPDVSFEAFAAGPAGRINMIELGGREVPEKDITAGLAVAQKEIDRLIEFQNSIIKEAGKSKTSIVFKEPAAELTAAIAAFVATRLEAAMYQPDKTAQEEALRALHRELLEHLRAVYATPENNRAVDEKEVETIVEKILDEMVHRNILEHDRRPDGRTLTQVRALSGEAGVFERTHGSAIFVRGNTRALAVTTLGAPDAQQLIETMETTGKRRFMLHYNFPPYSVGEIGNFRGPGRREIGHGALAHKAILPLLPNAQEFPYTIRVVSEILSSNGSSSMATVCAVVLSLMDAGVPIKKPAAGIAMGLALGQNGKYKILTDLQGPEDHYGDMDFKVAGTKDGVNAVQLDVKVEGLTLEIIEKTMIQARVARLAILDFMQTVLDKPRQKLSPFAPVIMSLTINPEKIGLVIGPGGKTINGMIKKFALAGIDIEDDGGVFVTADAAEKAQQAIAEIRALTREFAQGEIVEGVVIKTLDFGAIVDLGGGQDGMIHVSELKNGYTKSVEEVVKVGDFVRAKIIRLEAGRIALSLKQLQ